MSCSTTLTHSRSIHSSFGGSVGTAIAAVALASTDPQVNLVPQTREA